MPRIFGVTIPDNKKILYSLPYLFGIGLTTAGVILKSAGIDPTKKASELSGEELGKIQKIIERAYKIEGDLRKEIGSNIKHYRETGTWRGSRLARRLPVKGRSKTNSRTTRGNVRRTMGSGRAKAAEKT
ncbi:MAG: 30S ribosomal protein S13 [Candidatus Yanofskybacteria bacterium]|nr:30S ribosomal protein S13 [Candidatus Yanofskybacteria bacterium]